MVDAINDLIECSVVDSCLHSSSGCRRSLGTPAVVVGSYNRREQ